MTVPAFCLSQYRDNHDTHIVFGLKVFQTVFHAGCIQVVIELFVFHH